MWIKDALDRVGSLACDIGSDIFFSHAMHLELPYVPAYFWKPGSVEDMVHIVYYASAGAEFVFSGGAELQMQQVTDTF